MGIHAGPAAPAPLWLAFACLLALGDAAGAGEFKVSAASSAREAVERLGALFASIRHGAALSVSSGASGALAKQIESGAPCDLFISASGDWMDYMESKGLLASGSRATIALNALVVVAKRPGVAAEMRGLAALERIAICAPGSSPAGACAAAAIRGAGMEEALAGKVVVAKDTRECLVYAARGEVDAAFVFKTDACASQAVSILFAPPPGSYPKPVFQAALTSAGAGNADAAAFLAFLASARARAVLAELGFELP